MTIDEAIRHCVEVAEENDLAAGTYGILAENNHNAYEKLTAETKSSRCAECAADHRQLAEWLTELKELRKLTIINPIIAGYNEVYEKLRKGDIEASNDKDLLKTAIDTLENVMPKYRRLSEENQKQKKQIAEYKRLLKAAVEGFEYIKPYTSRCDGRCNNCPFDNEGWCRLDWKYADEAMKLIGGDTE
ncbi:hypothetical protein [Ruminococcus sp.]|uniref:hypothetical protein n=1 Tax=Ruminococcus sp. TaxID=41978 RepID=UPI0025D01282|nr:hypothetical protein [Ruminococcus sp.]